MSTRRGGFEVDTGDTERRLRGLATEFTDLRPLWPLVIRPIREAIKDHFRSEGKGRWAPLSAAYRAYKDRVRPGRDLLVFDGGLKRVVLAGGKPSYRARDAALTFASPIIGFHQEGTSKMPARPPIPDRLDETHRSEIRQVVDRWAGEVARKWGFA